MGLAERRAAKEFQEKQLPELQKEIHKLAGFPVPIEINWEQLSVEGQSHNYKEAWPELYWKPVIEAFRLITRDDMGKEALKASLKKIEFRNASGAYSPHSAISFQNGCVTIDHDLSNTSESYTKERSQYLVEIIEKAL